MAEPIVDRDFAAKFLRAVDRPMEYGVYHLINEWWEGAPQAAIDAYEAKLRALPGVEAFLAERWLADPLDVDALAAHAPGTLGHGYRNFIVDHHLEANLGVNYKTMHEQLVADGKLDRQPEDLRYLSVRGFQIHDVLHVLTGHAPDPAGELGMAAFHFAQLGYPYHAMRTAVTTAYVAFVAPQFTEAAMDMLARGWLMGRSTPNLHFVKWEEHFDDPIDELRERYAVDILPMVA